MKKSKGVIMFTAENSGRHKKTGGSTRKQFEENREKWFQDPGIFLIVAGLVAAFIIVVLTLMFPAEGIAAMPPGLDSSILPSQAREGSLFFKDENGRQYVSALHLNTDVTIEITGMVAYARVVQEFKNPGASWLEGVYVFPLPEDAAVSHLAMDVGDRVIEGVVRVREEARKTYSEAKREGRKASLLEQERPNIFMISVANIGPHEKIRVELEYQQTLRLDKNIFSLRFPIVVGPRYIPVPQNGVEGRLEEFDISGLALAAEIPDSSRSTPPVVDPGQDQGNQVSLEVILDPGFNLTRLQSLYHAVDVSYGSDDRVLIRLNNTWASADRDFVLQWAPEEENGPRAALFAEEKKGENFIYLMVMPPAEKIGAGYHIPREVIFVVDVSGSMGGSSINQAKEALHNAVSRLLPEDRFNIITFNSTLDKLFQRWY
jgi:Ca-activated chloride channel family protein